MTSALGTVSFTRLVERASSLAGGLYELGVHEDDTVLLMLGNSLEHVLAWIGIAFAGAVEVPVNTSYVGNMLQHVINDSSASVIIVSHEFVSQIVKLADVLPALQTLIVCGEADDLEPAHASRFRRVDFSALEAIRAPARIIDRKPWDLIAIMYTSGTTGPAKGVRITHAHAFTHCLPGDTGGPQADDVVLVSLPLFHIAGQWNGVYQAWIQGAAAALLNRFSAGSFWRDAAALGATYTTLLGAQASFLLAQPPSPGDRHHGIKRLSMLPLVPDLQAFRDRFGIEGVRTGYGTSEGSSPIGADFNQASPGACGWLKPGFQARLVDEHDLPVIQGRPGELLLRSNQPWVLMQGYYGLPDKTAEAFRNQWLHTGDLFRQDESGQFFFLDRNKDSIRRRGENISSFEVEREVCAHPLVADAAAIAVPSEHTEDELMVFIVLRDSPGFEVPDLIQFLAGRVPRHMIPRYVEVVADLPRTPTNRVQKHVLRARGISEATWDRQGLQTPRGHS